MATAPKSKSGRNIQKKRSGVNSIGISRAVTPDTAFTGSGIALATAGPDRLDPVAVTHEERHKLIAEAAYFRAQSRNFVPGYELEDWLMAEAEIETKFSESQSLGDSRNGSTLLRYR